MTKRVLILLIIAGALAGGGYLVAHQRAKRVENEAHRQREAALAQVEGLQAAARVKQSKLESALGQNDLLAGAVEELQVQLAEVGAVKPRIREVIKWRTPDIVVPPEKVCPTFQVQVPTVEDHRIDEPVPFRFRIEGDEARLVTELGNIFATGTVKLWRVAPPPEEVLGAAVWRSDVTDLLVAEDSIPEAPRRWAIGLGWTGGQFQGVTGLVSRDLFKRFRIQGGAGWMQSHGTGTGTADVIIDGEFLGTVVQDYELDTTGWVWSVAGFWRL